MGIINEFVTGLAAEMRADRMAVKFRVEIPESDINKVVTAAHPDVTPRRLMEAMKKAITEALPGIEGVEVRCTQTPNWRAE